jgi:hypothetical protein
MKLITKLTLVVGTLAALGTSSVFADDPQLRNRLDLERAKAGRSEKTVTVAVYAGRRGVGRAVTVERKRGSHFELRTTAHGQTYGAFVPNE